MAFSYRLLGRRRPGAGFLGGHHLDIPPAETDKELESQGHVLSDLDRESGQSLAKVLGQCQKLETAATYYVVSEGKARPSLCFRADQLNVECDREQNFSGTGCCCVLLTTTRVVRGRRFDVYKTW